MIQWIAPKQPQKIPNTVGFHWVKTTTSHCTKKRINRTVVSKVNHTVVCDCTKTTPVQLTHAIYGKHFYKSTGSQR